MDDWNAALRLTSVFAVIAFIALAASVYEIDRREKSSTDTVTASLADLDQQVQLLSNRVRILSNQYARQIEADQRRIQALANQIEALSNQHETRLKQLEEAVRTRRSRRSRAAARPSGVDPPRSGTRIPYREARKSARFILIVFAAATAPLAPSTTPRMIGSPPRTGLPGSPNPTD